MMIEQRIQQIETRLRESSQISDETKSELLNLLDSLKEELERVTTTHEEDARSLARFVDASTHEATRSEKKPKLINAALTGLTASAESFEASHPKLAQVVNQIATILSNMGL